MDISSIPDEQLLAEMNRRDAERKAALMKKKQEYAALTLLHVNTLLLLVPEHDRTSCSDADVCNDHVNGESPRCVRCALLAMTASGENYDDLIARISLSTNLNH